MAPSKFTMLLLLLSLVFTVIRADVSVEGEVTVSDGLDSSAVKIELDQLKSKIHFLESLVDEKTQELKAKDETMSLKEKLIQEKSDNIVSLEKELTLLQKKRTLDAAEKVGKAHARAGELEKKVDKLKEGSKRQQKEKEALEARANETEKKISELRTKLAELQKINDEQKRKIRKTERALKVAEEEMMKAKSEVTSKAKELTEVHGAWLPPWLALHLFHCQSLIATHWNDYGKPAMDVAIQKALEKKAQADKWAEPHLETVKTKWLPALKEQWLVFTTNVEPHVQSLKTKTIEAYEASKTAITPHVIRVKEIVDPYFQETKKFSKPYIDQVATVAKPHVDSIQLVLKPYTKKIVHAYGKFLKSATTYHHQVQASVKETLNKHELTRLLSTKEFVWFAASALLALPIIILSRIFSAFFCKKARKPARHANAHHSRRKGKRSHPDK
ncbi:uncharacterized protein LOC123200903 [Mangifera indica]|uniref:uncharacterized protein LOC123200903 n=1 Tax=Mangifera indica TaxID=29780 RepID=UPI001CF99640|nr:uncharacterized protein LOC123200903 [Mangifera indica]XP_044472219.1 uncharacterized protein LOC123200903 [Mangifera indica]